MAVRVSIVIPTRNRPAMAVLAVHAALDAIGPDDEVILADNGDLPLHVERSDPRLRVLRADRVYSMPDNWERAVAAARGQDLLVLSDKHRLVQGGLDHLLAARKSERDVVTYTSGTLSQSVGASEIDRFEAIAEAPGTVQYFRGPRACKQRSSPDMLKDWYESVQYRPERPMLYSAIVPRHVVDDVVRAKGRFFQGMAPDVCSSLHILAATRTYIETNFMVVLSHFPSADNRWSNGVSLTFGKGDGAFLREFGNSPLGRMPPLTSSAIYQTLIEFSRLQPESVPPEMVSMSRFARAAAVEIEASRRVDAASMHWALLKATQATGIGPRAFFEQLRTLLSSRVLGGAGFGRALKRLLGRPDGMAIWAQSNLVPTRSLAEALGLLAAANGPLN